MGNIVACTEPRIKFATSQSSVIGTEVDQQKIVVKCESRKGMPSESNCNPVTKINLESVSNVNDAI